VASSAISSGLSALSAFGRFSVIVASAPAISVRINASSDMQPLNRDKLN
jgi:hypothetical protein